MLPKGLLRAPIVLAIAVGCSSGGGSGGGGGGGGGNGPDTTPPPVPDLGRVTVGSPLPGGISTVVGSNGAVEASAMVRVVNVTASQRNGGETVQGQSGAGTDGSFSTSVAAQLGDALTITAIDAAGNQSVPANVNAGPTPIAYTGGIGTSEQRVYGSGVGAFSLSFPTGSETYVVIAEPQNPGGEVFLLDISGAMGVTPGVLGGSAARTENGGFESRLRAYERDAVFPRLLHATPDMYERRGLRLAQDEERTFFVVNTTGIPVGADDFDVINAQLRFTGDNVLIYVDDRTPAENLTEGMIQQIGNRVDDEIFPTDVAAFGEISDVDGDGRFIFLMSPTVNSLTPPGSSSFIGGFFFGFDLTPFQFSNQAEMFYATIPDPDETFGAAVPIAGFVDAVSATAAHEIEHMISANQHVLVRGGQAEDIWIDEGLAHYGETLNGFDTQNLLRSAIFLESPNSTPMVGTDADDSLARRGAAWLLVAYLVQLHGEQILADLVQTNFIGVVNVERQADTSFPFLLHRFYSALFLDGLGVSTDPGLEFDLDLRSRYSQAQASGVFTPPLGPYLGITNKTATASGATSGGIARGTGAQYFQITSSQAGTFPVLVEADARSEMQVSIMRIE